MEEQSQSNSASFQPNTPPRSPEPSRASSEPVGTTIIELHDVPATSTSSFRGPGDATMRARSSLIQPTLDSPVGDRHEKRKDAPHPNALPGFLSFLPPSVTVPLSPVISSLRETVLPSLTSIITRERNPAAEIFIKKKPLLRILFSSKLMLHGGLVTASLLLFILLEIVSPSFVDFPYFYLSFSGLFTSNSLLFLYLWGAVLGSLVAYYKPLPGATALSSDGDVKPRSGLTNRVFLIRTAHVLLQSVAEELGHHGFYIISAMAGFSTFTWVIRNMGFWLGIAIISIGGILIVLTILASFQLVRPPRQVQQLISKYDLTHLFVGCMVVLALGLALMVIGLVFDLVFDFWWEWLMFPFMNITSLWRFDNLWNGLFGAEFQARPRSYATSRSKKILMKKNKIMLIGIVVANLLYRDGNKLYGVFGFINAWYVGLILMNVTLQYGIFTAIVARLIYELEFMGISLLFKKLGIHSKSRDGPILMGTRVV